jgi:hypothetical protein
VHLYATSLCGGCLSNLEMDSVTVAPILLATNLSTWPIGCREKEASRPILIIFFFLVFNAIHLEFNFLASPVSSHQN